MREESPPPIVPQMVTDESDPEPELRSDGGRETPPDRTFGAPLVPDCS